MTGDRAAAAPEARRRRGLGERGDGVPEAKRTRPWPGKRQAVVNWRRIARLDALALTALIWFLAKFLRYAFPPLFPTLKATYDVGNAAVGTAFTALMLVYAAMQFPSGAVADRIGGVRVIAGGATVAAVAALALSASLPFPAVVGAMVLVGLGTGAHKTVAVRLVSRVYPARTGRALGVMDTFGAFGGVVAPAAVVAATDASGWRTVFLAGGAAGLVLAALFAARVPRRTPDDGGVENADDGEGLGRYVALFGDRRFVAFVGVTVLFSFAYNGAVAFLPVYLETRAGLPSATAGTIYAALFLVSVVQVVTGDLADRMGELRVIGATLVLAAAALAGVVALADAGPLALGAAVVAFGIGSHGFRPVRGSFLVSVVPESVAGGSLGVVRTLIMGAGAFAPAIVGAVADAAGFGAAFGLLVASMAGAVAAAAVVALIGSG